MDAINTFCPKKLIITKISLHTLWLTYRGKHNNIENKAFINANIKYPLTGLTWMNKIDKDPIICANNCKASKNPIY